jgi:hypothetical protein
MEKTLVKYRTTKEMGFNNRTHYAVVPTIFLSDLLEWLSDTECKVLGVSNNCDSEVVLPIEWIGYRSCRKWVDLSDAMTCAL